MKKIDFKEFDQLIEDSICPECGGELYYDGKIIFCTNYDHFLDKRACTFTQKAIEVKLK